jgi:hypothetical protein
MKMHKIWISILAVATLFVSCDDEDRSPAQPPIFTDPAAKLSRLSGQNFMQLLLSEAVALEPLVTTSGAQIHMGFWSAAGNHGSLVRVLDSINATPSTATPPQRGIWDEGVSSSIQYRQYVLMNDEFWYERAYFTNGVGVIRGITYTDPHPVTPANADDIWGAYSQRYADMATSIYLETSNKVKVWCFVNGGRKTRIFFKYEFPELQALEASGFVQVFFAERQDSDWTVPTDWKEGTQNAPTPLDSSLASYSLFTEPVQSSKIEEEIVFDVADAYLDGVFGQGNNTASQSALEELSRRNPGFTSAAYEDAFARGVIVAAH